jgi:hydantoinase/carbamoylase family amidase
VSSNRRRFVASGKPKKLYKIGHAPYFQKIGKRAGPVAFACQGEDCCVSANLQSGTLGRRIMALCDDLAQWSESPDGLTCTYLSPAHRATADAIIALMKDAGLTTQIDAVGNVVGRYRSHNKNAKTFIVGSHYDTVTNAGKYDGRLGIATALAVVEHLARAGQRLPFHLDVIAFSEEEGVRFPASYIGSSAIAGQFDPDILTRRDAAGVSLAEALRDAGLDPAAIPSLVRRRDDVAGYLEVHIEQGPVLLDMDLPVGIVTAIAGNSRFIVTVNGAAGHAGTVPMSLRHDAAAAAAEIVLYVERRCSQSGLLGTVGRLSVLGGAINVIPACCELSLDIRSGDDTVRKAAVDDIFRDIERIVQRRGVTIDAKPALDVPAVPCSPRLQQELAASIERCGVPVHRLASGAGHDAVMFASLTDVAMLFVRCGNGGVSHSPREIITVEDADVGARVLLDVLQNLQP